MRKTFILPLEIIHVTATFLPEFQRLVEKAELSLRVKSYEVKALMVSNLFFRLLNSIPFFSVFYAFFVVTAEYLLFIIISSTMHRRFFRHNRLDTVLKSFQQEKECTYLCFSF